MKQNTRNDWIGIHLPSRRQFIRFIVWTIGRLTFSFSLFTLEVVRISLQCIISVIEWCKVALKRVIRLYDQLPYAGTYQTNVIETSLLPVDTPNEIITDIISTIEGKQLMIIGEMGTGKSTLAQYLAYTVGGKVKVYECEGTPDDWVGLEVIGKGENWSAIEQGMLDDLDDLSNQMKIRNERGDNALVGTEKVIICEEYPELVNKVECSSEWLERHARRGRKARRFTILLSQYDRVSAWGLEGKSDLADAFYRLRLGKKAVNHAKSLKDDALVSWLTSDRSHCLLDDTPCKLPSYREMKAVTVRLQLPVVTQNHQETRIAQNDLLPRTKLSVTVNSSKGDLDSGVLKRAILGLLEAGMSDSRVIKEVMGYEGGNYQKGKALLEQLKNVCND